MRILIVEDEPTLGQQLKSTLEQNGYAVDLSTDGEDGHYLGSSENYDAVILDLGLPEIDGLTVLGMWRKEGRTFPVLVLSDACRMVSAVVQEIGSPWSVVRSVVVSVVTGVSSSV